VKPDKKLVPLDSARAEKTPPIETTVAARTNVGNGKSRFFARLDIFDTRDTIGQRLKMLLRHSSLPSLGCLLPEHYKHTLILFDVQVIK
jgi:hypothetical protein